MFAYSSSESTITAVPVNIGNANVKKYVNHDYKHLVGKDYPLYGIKTRVPKNKNPKFNRMSQLAALVALEIVNEGDGKANGEANIEIRNVSYEVKNENIVGGFKVDITGDEPSFANGTSPANKTTVTIVDDNDKDSFISIAPGDSAKIYFAVKPHDASGKSVTITVNGSSRTITMPANTKFKMGQATTIRVPVKLSYPKDSDALGTQPAGYEFITWENMRSAELNVNGEKVNAYIVGEGGKAGKIIIEGTARDLINGMDVGFYASTWSGKKSAMTVSRINLWMPEYNSDGTLKKHTQIASYGPLQNAVEEIAIDVLGVLGRIGWNTIGKPAFAYMLQDGIPKVKEKDTDLLTLTQFMDAANITFSNVIENSALEGATSLIMLDENPIYKEVGSAAVAKLLEEKFDHKDENNNIIIPTYEGLCHIVNGVESTKADVTANAIFGKLKSTIGNQKVSLMSSLTINVWDIFSAIFPDAATMKRIMGDLKVRVYISTCPYGTDTAYNPMIFWGLDAYGPDKSAPGE